MFGEEVAANENGHAAGDFAHGFEQRQPAIHFEGFVSQRRHPGLHQRFGQQSIRREMEIREQHLVWAQQAKLGRQRFLHLDDQFRLLVNGGVRIHQLRAATANPAAMISEPR